MNKYTNEQGRSMIEMLGVLAIVGVLSVAGIMGYSKAMAKYKANQIVDQMSFIRHNLQEIYGKQRSYEGIESLDDAVALGIFPEEMTRTYATTGEVRHAGSGTVTIAFEDDNVSVSFNDLTNEAAIALSITDFHANTYDLESE